MFCIRTTWSIFWRIIRSASPANCPSAGSCAAGLVQFRTCDILRSLVGESNLCRSIGSCASSSFNDGMDTSEAIDRMSSSCSRKRRCIFFTFMRWSLFDRNIDNGDAAVGELDGENIGIPRYSGTIAGDARSTVALRSRIVFLSSWMESLQSAISASKRWTSTQVSLCFSKYH